MKGGLVRLAGVALVGVGWLVAEGTAWAGCPRPDTLAVGDPCKKYGEDDDGAWSSDFGLPFVATMALRSLSYAPKGGASFDGNVENSPVAYHFPATQLGAGQRTFGVEATAAWIPVRYAYVGLSLGIGAGQWAPPAFTASSLELTSRGTLDATVIDYDVVLGLRLPLGVLSARGEVAVGGSSVSLSQYANSNGNTLTASASTTVLLLEPRAALDFWVTPNLTLSLVGAMPWFTPAATDAGVAFAVHTRVFDGG
jgi:hypothetical protein